MRNSINSLIDKFKLDKVFICDKFRIPERKYKDFVSGSFNYSVMEMAILNALFIELETEALKDEAPFQVAPYKSSKTKTKDIAENIVSNYKTKHPKGFLKSEIDEILKSLPEIKIEKFNEAMGVVTVGIIDNQTLYYRHDVELAIRCCIENRSQTSSEFD
jgi:hypothetical protein